MLIEFDNYNFLHEMRARAEVVRDCYEGTYAIRRKGRKYLRRLTNEDGDSYMARLNRSTLLPYVKRVIDTSIGLVSACPIDYSSVPKELLQKLVVAGYNSASFTHLCAQAGRFALIDGMSFLTASVDGDGNIYSEVVPASKLTALEIEDGQVVSIEYKIKDGSIKHTFGLITVRTGSKIEEFQTGIDSLSVVPFFGERAHSGIGISPYEDLAHLCIKHYEAVSNQDTIVMFARQPIILAKGLDMPDNPEKNDAILGNIMFVPHDASVEFVEHTGNSIEAGRQHILDIEAQIKNAGASILMENALSMTVEQANQVEAARQAHINEFKGLYLDSVNNYIDVCAKLCKINAVINLSFVKDEE